MLKGYYLVKKCRCGFGCILCGGDPDEDEDKKCGKCKQLYEYVEIHSCTDPSKVIVAAEAELEDANFHSIGSLPSKLFEVLAPLVEDKLKLAWAIAGSMPS